MDAKNQLSKDADAEKGGFVGVGMMHLPLRRKWIVSDVLKIVLCFAILAYGHSLACCCYLFGFCC